MSNHNCQSAGRGPVTSMHLLGRFFACCAILLLASLPSQAGPQRGGPSVVATLESGVIRLGETTQVTVIAEGTRDARLREIPTVEGLSFGRPQQGLYQSFVNGRASVRVRFDIPMRAEIEGELTIPPFIVEVGAEKLETRPLELRVVRDLRGEDLGYLEVAPSALRVVEGQPLSIELLLGLDPEMDFAQPILPWWEELPGTVELESRPQATGSRTTRLAVNGRIEVEAEILGLQERDGRSFKVFRLERRVLPVRSGTLEVARSHVEFGRLGEDRGFSSRGSRKLDSFYLSADAFEVEVVPLPSEGQPVEFGGAVGNLTVRARTDTRDVLVGDSIKLTVDWEGEGNLEFFDVPDPGRIDAFRELRVYGKTEEKSADRRRVTYDLTPLSEDVQEIPALPITIYDPYQERYVTLSTEPIPIRVRPLEGGGGLLESETLETVRDIRDIDGRSLKEDVRRPGLALGDTAVGGALFGLPVVLLGLRGFLRRRAGDPSLPAARRRRRALAKLKSAVASNNSPAAVARAFSEFLAARTDEPAAAWEGRDARQWNRTQGESAQLSEDAAAALDELRARLDSAVYGGGEAVSKEELLAAAEAAVEAGL